MNTRKVSILLGLLGMVSVIAGVLMMQFGVAFAYHEGLPFPTDFNRSNYTHLGSKSISPDAASALGLPPEIFGNTFDAVFANGVATNDLRSGNRPFRDGATFVAPFYTLTNPVAGLDATGDLAFVAVMMKDTEHFADTGGWGFEAFAPDGTRLTDLRPSCFTCHQSQQANDYVFSTLVEREVSAVPASDNGVFLPTDYRNLFWLGAKVIRPDAAGALGLPVEIFGDTFDSVYANVESWTALDSGARPFPVGSLFVAEFHQAAYPIDGLAAFGDLAFTAVMLKGQPGTGDDPSTGDWRFEAFGPDGTPLTELRGACISCHASQAGNDFVFTGAQAAEPAATQEVTTGGACTASPAGGDANIRSGPGTEFDPQGNLAAGSTATVDGQATGTDGQVWYHLVAEANSWVRADVVNTSGDCSAVPTIQP
jgi:hypothetical protein